jgi:hypothetical protein
LRRFFVSISTTVRFFFSDFVYVHIC